MTKEQYVRMNRGINDSRDLPESYLSGIYDEIAGNEIKMKNVSKKSLGKSLVDSTPKEEQNFTEGKHLEHIRPMFKVCSIPDLVISTYLGFINLILDIFVISVSLDSVSSLI